MSWNSYVEEGNIKYKSENIPRFQIHEHFKFVPFFLNFIRESKNSKINHDFGELSYFIYKTWLLLDFFYSCSALTKK